MNSPVRLKISISATRIVLREIVIYDANVLYPAPLRDLLVRIAGAGLVRARSSNRILDECFRNLLLKRSDIRESSLERTRFLMNEAIRDVLIADTTIEPLNVILPDPDDVHVLNAAVAANARWIITFNLKDFPDSALAPFGVTAIHPDHFLHELMRQVPDVVVGTIHQQSAALKSPVQSFAELLDTLERNGLDQTVAAIRGLTRGE